MSCTFVFVKAGSDEPFCDDTIMSYRLNGINNLFYYPNTATRAIVICDKDGNPRCDDNCSQIRFYDYNNNYILSKYVTRSGTVYMAHEEFCNFVRRIYESDCVSVKKEYPIAVHYNNTTDKNSPNWYPSGAVKAVLHTYGNADEVSHSLFNNKGIVTFHNSHGTAIGSKKRVMNLGGNMVTEYDTLK